MDKKEYEKRDEESKRYHEKLDRDLEFLDAFLAADFKRMGYIYAPLWFYYRPQGIIREEYYHYQRGEPVGKGRLIASVSALSTYFLVSVYSVFRLLVYTWNLYLDKIEEHRILREEKMVKYKDDDSRSSGLKVVAKLVFLIVVINVLSGIFNKVYSYIREKVNEKDNSEDKDKESFENVSSEEE